MDTLLITTIGNPLGKPIEIDPGVSRRSFKGKWRRRSLLFDRRNRHQKPCLSVSISYGWAITAFTI